MTGAIGWHMLVQMVCVSTVIKAYVTIKKNFIEVPGYL